MPIVTFHPLAERELLEAARYYDLESPGLGVTFLNVAERCKQSILEHPHAGTAIGGEVRRRLFRAFPYAFLYKVKPKEIRILAVMNLKRRPSYWVGRE